MTKRIVVLWLFLWTPIVGLAAFPQVDAANETSFSSDATTHNCAMPASGVDSGDLLMVMLALDSDSSVVVTTPSGWTLVDSDNAGAAPNGRYSGLFLKSATGSEGGTNVNFVSDDAEAGACQSYVISGWHGTLTFNGACDVTTLECSFAQNGPATSRSNPTLTPSWGAEDTLWFACANLINDVVITSFPTNYTTNNETTPSGDSSGGTVNCGWRELNATSETPGTFTASGSSPWHNWTIGIRPTASGSFFWRRRRLGAE